MSISLYDHQRSALEKMKDGCILCGGVGSGKSRTALAYYYLQQGGNLDIPDAPMKNPLDIYIITTARKRDTCEWENELAPFLLSIHEDCNYSPHGWRAGMEPTRSPIHRYRACVPW